MEANKNLYRSSEMSKVLSSSTPKATRPGNFKRITHHLYLEVLLLFYISVCLSVCLSVCHIFCLIPVSVGPRDFLSPSYNNRRLVV